MKADRCDVKTTETLYVTNANGSIGCIGSGADPLNVRRRE